MLSNINQTGVLRNHLAVSNREVLLPAAFRTQVFPAGQLPGHYMALSLVCKHRPRHHPSGCVVGPGAFDNIQLRPHPVSLALSMFFNRYFIPLGKRVIFLFCTFPAVLRHSLTVKLIDPLRLPVDICPVAAAELFDFKAVFRYIQDNPSFQRTARNTVRIDVMVLFDMVIIPESLRIPAVCDEEIITEYPVQLFRQVWDDLVQHRQGMILLIHAGLFGRKLFRRFYVFVNKVMAAFT